MCYGKVPRHLTWQGEGIPVDVSTSKSQEWPCPTQHTLGKLHTIEHHAQYINWGILYTVKSCCSGTGCTLVSGWWAVVLCTTFLSWVLFLSVFLSPFSLLLISAIFHIISVIKLSLSQPMGFRFFPILLPLPLGGRGSEENLCGT